MQDFVVVLKYHWDRKHRQHKKVSRSRNYSSQVQTGLSFITDDKTYKTTNSKDVWCKSGQSGLDKQQCTMQLTVFADGIPRIRLLILFRGQRLHVKNIEKEQCDIRVTVQFQKNAWCE